MSELWSTMPWSSRPGQLVKKTAAETVVCRSHSDRLARDTQCPFFLRVILPTGATCPVMSRRAAACPETKWAENNTPLFTTCSRHLAGHAPVIVLPQTHHGLTLQYADLLLVQQRLCWWVASSAASARVHLTRFCRIEVWSEVGRIDETTRQKIRARTNQ